MSWSAGEVQVGTFKELTAVIDNQSTHRGSPDSDVVSKTYRRHVFSTLSERSIEERVLRMHDKVN